MQFHLIFKVCIWTQSGGITHRINAITKWVKVCVTHWARGKPPSYRKRKPGRLSWA